MDPELRLRHAPVLAQPLDRLGDALGFAEGLDGDARDRPHLIERDHIAGVDRGLIAVVFAESKVVMLLCPSLSN